MALARRDSPGHSGEDHVGFAPPSRASGSLRCHVSCRAISRTAPSTLPLPGCRWTSHGSGLVARGLTRAAASRYQLGVHAVLGQGIVRVHRIAPVRPYFEMQVGACDVASASYRSDRLAALDIVTGPHVDA